MMPRRTHERERVVGRAVDHRLGRRQHAAGREQRGTVCVGAGVRIGIEVEARD